MRLIAKQLSTSITALLKRTCYVLYYTIKDLFRIRKYWKMGFWFCALLKLKPGVNTIKRLRKWEPKKGIYQGSRMTHRTRCKISQVAASHLCLDLLHCGVFLKSLRWLTTENVWVNRIWQLGLITWKYEAGNMSELKNHILSLNLSLLC